MGACGSKDPEHPIIEKWTSNWKAHYQNTKTLPVKKLFETLSKDIVEVLLEKAEYNADNMNTSENQDIGPVLKLDALMKTWKLNILCDIKWKDGMFEEYFVNFNSAKKGIQQLLDGDLSSIEGTYDTAKYCHLSKWYAEKTKDGELPVYNA